MNGHPDHIRKEFTCVADALAALNGEVPARILLAVSGGSDSMGLLQLAARVWDRSQLVVGFVDHGLRDGVDSEWNLVRKAATSLNIDAKRARVDTSPADGGGLQEWARKARYALLLEMAESEEAAYIATAHTMDDQAETLMLRILRGTGIDGLAGIPPHRKLSPKVSLVRPMLRVTRNQVREYLREMNCPWAEDPSNENSRFARVRVRRELLPLMEELQPHVSKRLASIAEESAGVVDFITKNIEASNPCENINLCNGVKVSHEVFERYPFPLWARLVRLALQRVVGDLRRFERVHLDNICSALQGGEGSSSHNVPGELSVWVFRANLFVFPVHQIPTPTATASTSVLDDSSFSLSRPDLGATAHIRIGSNVYSYQTAGKNLGNIRESLCLRTRQIGDRVAHGGKKLGAIFTNAKIPVFYRDYIPVISTSEGIISIPSVLTSEEPGIHITWEIDSRSPFVDLKIQE